MIQVPPYFVDQISIRIPWYSHNLGLIAWAVWDLRSGGPRRRLQPQWPQQQLHRRGGQVVVAVGKLISDPCDRMIIVANLWVSILD